MNESQRSRPTTRRVIVSSLVVGTVLATLLVPLLVVLYAFDDHTMVFYAIYNGTPAQLEAKGNVGNWAADSASANSLHRSIVIDRDIDQVYLVESKDPKSGTVEVDRNDFWIAYKPGPTSRAIATVFVIAILILTTIISVMSFVVRMVRPFLKRRLLPRGFEVVPQELAASIHDVDQKRRQME